MKRRDEILEELNKLSSSENFLEILLLTTNQNLNRPYHDLGKVDSRNFLNENELAFLFGLWLKNKDKCSPALIDKNAVISKIESLMNDYHLTFIDSFSKVSNQTSYLDQVKDREEVIKETNYYSGSGAYDLQYVNFVYRKYEKDKAWLINNRSYDIDYVDLLYSYIKNSLTIKLNENKYHDVFDLHSFSFNTYGFKKYPQFEQILNSVSINLDTVLNQDFNDIGDLNYFRLYPVIKTESRFIIPIPYLLAEALYDNPFYWMKDDESYKDIAFKHRGESAVKIVKHFLSTILTDERIYENVNVSERKGKYITDLDVCIVKDNKMLVVQVKSKRLTQLSKQGNIEKFEEDFKKAIVDANNQAKKPIKNILDRECTLVVSETGEKVDYSQIDDIQTMCLVLDSYPAVTTHTRMHFDKGLSPIAISVFDLEVLVKYLKNFDTLFDYIKKRELVSHNYISENELGFLSFYLKEGFKCTQKEDIIFIDNSYSQYFDDDYYKFLVRNDFDKYISLIKNIGRNDFCICGSGKKAKRCCLIR